MRGVVFTADRRLEIADFDDPAPGPGDAVVAMRASGAALAAFGLRGRTGGIIAGHEPCGVVAAVGAAVDPRTVRVGDEAERAHAEFDTQAGGKAVIEF